MDESKLSPEDQKGLQECRDGWRARVVAEIGDTELTDEQINKLHQLFWHDSYKSHKTRLASFFGSKAELSSLARELQSVIKHHNNGACVLLFGDTQYPDGIVIGDLDRVYMRDWMEELPYLVRHE